MKGRPGMDPAGTSQPAMEWQLLHQPPVVPLGRAFDVHVAVYTVKKTTQKYKQLSTCGDMLVHEQDIGKYTSLCTRHPFTSNLNCLSVLFIDINPHSCFLEFRICTFHNIIINMFLQKRKRNQKKNYAI